MPIPTMDAASQLFSAAELKDHLGAAAVSEARAVAVERVVWGWLKPVLALTERPDPVPAEVFSWAIELGGIAHENPAGLSSKQLGPAQEAFSAERRREILAEAASGGTTVSGVVAPRGSFPKASTYPDPACW